MASYSNLTSLEGLQVGDIVTYTANTVVDTKGYKFKAELYGGGTNSYGTGGFTTAIVDTSQFPEKTISIINYLNSWSLSYGSFSDYATCLYYRFLVAGAGGAGRSAARTGDGGGESGTAGTRYSTAYSYPGEGGTQTSGGAGGKGYTGTASGTTNNGSDGTFGYGGAKCTGSSYATYSYNGGAGWYGGGGTGGYSSTTYPTGSGGGSGFVIGTTTTTYPSGYMGDDSSLIETISSAISEGASNTAGGIQSTTVSDTSIRTVLTITEVASSVLYEEDVSAAEDGSIMLTLEASENEGEYIAKIEGTGELRYGRLFNNLPSDFGSLIIVDCTISEGITKIDINNFVNVNIWSCNLPSTLTTIEEGAFSGTTLGSITIPSNVSYIGDGVWYGSPTNLELAEDNPYFYIDNDFLMEKSTLRAVCTIQGTEESKDEIIWPANGIKIIESNCIRFPFTNDITVPETVEEIKHYGLFCSSRVVYLNKNIKILRGNSLDGTGDRTVYIPFYESDFRSKVELEEAWDTNIIVIYTITVENKFQYYSDTNFQNSNTYYYDGTKFIKVEPKLYQNGIFK